MAGRGVPSSARGRARVDTDADAPVRPIVAAAASADGGRRNEGGADLPLGKKGQRTRARILAAAYEQFSETGYRGTRVSDISQRAGVSLGAFYQYFRDRTHIMSTLVGEAVRGELGARRAPWRMRDGTAGIRSLLDDYVRNYEATAAFQGVWEEASHADDGLAAVRRDLVRWLTESVEREFRRAQRDGTLADRHDPALLARALTAMVDRYCYLTYVVDGDASPDPAASIDVLTSIWCAALGFEPPR